MEIEYDVDLAIAYLMEIEELDLDVDTAITLAEAGYNSPEDLARMSIKECLDRTKLPDQQIFEVVQNAIKYLIKRDGDIIQDDKSGGVMEIKELTPEEEQAAREWSKKFDWKEEQIKDEVTRMASMISYYNFRYNLAKANADNLKYELLNKEAELRLQYRQTRVPASGGKQKAPTENMVSEFVQNNATYAALQGRLVEAKKFMEVCKGDVEAAFAKKDMLKTLGFLIQGERQAIEEMM